MKNPTDILIDGTKFPAAIEAKLPAGAPKISTMLATVVGKLPKLPDLPVDIPAPPEPVLPGIPAAQAMEKMRRYVTGVEVTPTPTPTPARKAIVPLVFE